MMKKWMFLLGVSLMLTGCSTTVTVSDTQAVVLANDSNLGIRNDINIGFAQVEGLYINDDMKNLIGDINNLNDKYKKDIDERDFDSLYIDVHSDSERLRNINFNNNYIYGPEHFKEIVQILDKNVAEGLEDHVMEMKNKDLKIDETTVNKIGKTIVYVQNRGRDGDNYINISLNFLDVKDEHYRDVFNQIANGKYILNNLIMGGELNLMEFVSPNNSYFSSGDFNVDIRYNMFLQDKDIEKVNILIQKKNDPKFKDEDMEVFINLLNSMELNEGEKDLLVEEYKGLLDEKLKNKKIDLANYKLLIKGSKGSSYSGRGKSLVCFSIERK